MISVWAKIYEGIPVYTDFKAKGYLYPRNIADRTKDWIAPGYTSTFYDPFNPAGAPGFLEPDEHQALHQGRGCLVDGRLGA